MSYAHDEEWMIMMISEMNYTIEFENASQIANFSYKGTFFGLEVSEFNKFNF